MTVYLISSGVISSGIAVQSGDSWQVNDGVLDGAEVSSGGNIFVFNGGSTSGADVLSGGVQISISGALTDATLQSGALQSTLFGGSESGTIISGGTAEVYFYGQSENDMILAGGSETVEDLGDAANTVVSNGGHLALQLKGTAYQPTVSSGGLLTVNSTGDAEWATISSGGLMVISNGGLATNTDILSGGVVIDLPGGALGVAELAGEVISTGDAVISGTQLVASAASGAALSGQVYTNSETATALSGGEVAGATVSSGATLNAYGGLLSGNTVASGGIEWVRPGGVAESTVVSSGGDISVLSGGVDSGADILSGGFEIVQSGGSAANTTVNAGGLLVVLPGGQATGYSGGGLVISTGEVVQSGVSLLSSTSGSWTTEQIRSGQTLVVLPGADDFGAQINSGGVARAVSGAGIDGATVASGGTLLISSGGWAYGTVLWTGGSAYVSNGGAGSIDVFGGKLEIGSGGEDSNATVTAGLFLVDLGGSASNITANGGSVQVRDGGVISGVAVNSQQANLQVYVGGSALGAVIGGGATMFDVYSGYDSGTLLSGGTENVSNGGYSVSATVASGGTLNIVSGGDAYGTVLQSGGMLSVGPDLTISSFTLQSGATFDLSGAEGFVGTVAGGATLGVGSGGLIYGVTASGWQAFVDVWSAGTAQATTIDSGASLNVFGGLASGITASGWQAQVVVFSGGAVDSATVDSGAQIVLYSGGAASATQVQSGATYVQYGGIDSATTLDGVQNVWGGSAISATVNSGGDQQVSSGGSAVSTTVLSGGSLYVSSGYASAAQISNGGSLVNAGGETFDTVILNGGSETVFGGAIAAGTTVSSGGELVLRSGANVSNTSVAVGGMIALHDIAYAASDTVSFNPATDLLTVSGGGASTTLSLVGNYAGEGFLAGVGGNGGIQLTVIAPTLQNVSSGVVVSNSLISGSYPDGVQSVESGGITSAVLVVSGGSLIVYTGGESISGTISAGGVEYLSGGSAVGDVVGSGGALVVTGGPGGVGLFVPPDPNNIGGTLSGVVLLPGGIIDLTQLAYTSGGYLSLNSSTDALTISMGGVTSTIALGGSYAGESFALSSGGWGGTAIEAILTASNRPQPTISGTLADQLAFATAPLKPFSSVVIGDVRADQSETVTVTPSATAVGSFSNLGSGSVNGATGAYTVAGTPGAVTAALEALVWTPVGLALNPSQSTTEGFTLSATDTGGATTTDATTSLLDAADWTLVGSATNLLGEQEADSFYLSPTGVIAFSYTLGGQTSYWLTTWSGNANNTGSGSTFIGTGFNLFGTGEHDFFINTEYGNVYAEEIGNAGQIVAATVLLASGSPLAVPAGVSAFGAANNLWGTGGADVFFRTAANSIIADEFNASGTATAGYALTVGGNPFSLDVQSTIVGNGLNIWGTGNRDIFVRTATGGLTAWEFDPNGVAQVAHTLDIGIDPFIIDNATTVAGSGFDFWGSGNADMFLRGGNGNISAWEFNYVGVATVGQNLMASAGVSFTLDAASTIVGTGLDFLGTTYEDIFVRSGSGQLSVDEFNPNALETATAALINANGTAFVIDSASSVIGAGFDFLGAGNHDLFIVDKWGDLSVAEFSSAGVLTGDTILGFSGFIRSIPLATTVIGTGFDLLDTGNNDIFVRNPGTNAISVYDYSSNGQMFGSVELMIGSNPFQLDGSSTIIGTGSDFFGSGYNDIFVRTSTDQIDAWEYTTAGVAVEGQQLTVAGQPFLLDGGSTIVGTGQNFWGTGGSDMFIRSAAGAMSVWEFNSAGVATVANGLSGFTLDGSSRVIGSSAGLYAAANLDLYTVNASGQLTVHEVNSSGTQTTSTTFTLTGVPQTDAVVGAGIDGNTSAQDIILQTATGQTTVYDISGTTLSAQSGLIVTTESNGNVVTVGTSAADTLTAGAAATTLIGGGGNDIYDLASNFSQATIMDGYWGTGGHSTLAFQSGSVGIANLWFDRVNDLGAVSSTGNNLRIDVLGTNQSVTSIHQALAEIEVSDGLKFLDSGLNALVSAMSAYEAAHPTFNPATAASAITDPTVLSAVTAAWHS